MMNNTLRNITSASNLHRRELCPGSEREEAKYRDEPESAEAREGIVLHNYRAEDGTLDHEALPYDVRWLYERAEALEERAINLAKSKLELTSEPEEFSEIPLVFRRGMTLELTGTADRVLVFRDENVVVVLDRKFGYLDVSPADINVQLRAYAVMAAKKWKCTTVVVAIIAPRLPKAECLTVARFEMHDLADAEEYIIATRDAARAPDAPLIASWQACQYCRAKAACSAYAKSLRIHAPEAIETLNDDQLDQLLSAIDLAIMIKDKVKDEARKRLIAAGDSLATHKLGKPKKLPEVTDARLFVHALIQNFDFSEGEIYETAKFSPARAREVIERKFPDKSKDQIETELNEACASAIDYKESQPTVLRKSAKELQK